MKITGVLIILFFVVLACSRGEKQDEPKDLFLSTGTTVKTAPEVINTFLGKWKEDSTQWNFLDGVVERGNYSYVYQVLEDTLYVGSVPFIYSTNNDALLLKSVYGSEKIKLVRIENL